jgi:acetyl esterase/lipase
MRLRAQESGFLGVEDINQLPSAPADARIAYGPDPDQFGDLRLPRGHGPFPVVIVIHGGCWVQRYADWRNTAALADALRGQGMATWNIEYRRADQPGGGWPGTFLDVAQAADALRGLARRYPLDVTRVVAIGHSAGGHLALWLAARPRLSRTSVLALPAPLAIRGVVLIGGIADLGEFQAKEADICGEAVVTRLMGGSPAERPARYEQGSPRQLLPIGVRQFFINGEEDPVVPPRDSIRFVRAARAAGDQADQQTVPAAGHFEYLSPATPAGKAACRAVAALLEVIKPAAK